MVMINLRLVKDKTTDEVSVAANGTASAGYVNHVIKVFKE